MTTANRRKTPVSKAGRLRGFIFSLTDYMYQALIPKDFFNLLTSGVSEGEQSVLNKALESFTQFISDDFEDCCFYCVQNQISIWDYYGTHSGDTRIPAVLNELWVEFLIQASDPESQFALK